MNSLDAWDMNPSLPERTLQVFEADAHPVDDRLRAATTKFMASATQYSFLVNCESRSGLAAAGPYRLGGDVLMHTRDFTNLAECDLSWLDGVAGDIPYNNLTMAIITDGVRMEITDWGTPYTTPEEYSGNITGVGLYTSDYLSDRYIPVGMGSATELADTLEQLADACSKATRSAVQPLRGFTNVQMVEAGVYTYLSSANGISHVAGTYKQSQWEFIDERTRRFWPLFNEEYAMDSYLDNFASSRAATAPPTSTTSTRSPTAPGVPGRAASPGPGRNSFPISRHVLHRPRLLATRQPQRSGRLPRHELAPGEDAALHDDPRPAERGRGERGGPQVQLAALRAAVGLGGRRVGEVELAGRRGGRALPVQPGDLAAAQGPGSRACSRRPSAICGRQRARPRGCPPHA